MARPFKSENFGRYLLTDRIAIGGMAEIFTAKVFGAMGFEKNVAIKRILPQFAEDSEFLRMFITEAKLVCHLDHPNIVQVYELGEIEGQYYIAMEFINGIDARQLWRTLAKQKQRMPEVIALYIGSEFLKGLEFAHRAVGPDGQLLGVVHRDVSPSNVLIAYRGDVKISDFGIALVRQESRTQVGVLKGKFGYMSPEQVAGMKVDHRSDIFAAGIVLTELLLGRRLFLRQSDFETLDRVLNVRLDVLDQHEEVVSPEVMKILRHALKREATERYQTAQEFCDAILENLYERRARITSDNLAAFIAEHVTPYINKGKDDGKPASSSAHPSPVISKSLISRPDLTPQPVETGELTETQEESYSAKDKHLADSKGVFKIEQTIDAAVPPLLPPKKVKALAPEETLLDSVDEEDEGCGEEEEAAAEQAGAYEDQDERTIPNADRAAILESVIDTQTTDFGTSTEAGAEYDLEPLDEEPPSADPDASSAESANVLVSGQLAFAHHKDASGAPSVSGKLSSISVAKVIFRLLKESETGLLVLSCPDFLGKQAEVIDWLRKLQTRIGAEMDVAAPDNRTCTIHFESGKPHLASSDRTEDMIVAYLVRTGVLSEARVEEALEMNPRRKAVAALLASGRLSPLQVSRHVTSYVLDIVLDSFSWADGEYSFYRGKECPFLAFPTGLDATSLIAKGIARINEARLDDYFKHLNGLRIFQNHNAPMDIEPFNPTPMLLEVYHSLYVPRTVEEVLDMCQRYGTLLSAKQALYLTLECELVLITLGV